MKQNEENEFLASFSQSVNVEEGYESCTCSSSCIRNEITILKNKIQNMENTISEKQSECGHLRDNLE